MSLTTLQSTLRQSCSRLLQLPVSSTAAPPLAALGGSPAAAALPAQPRQLTSLLSSVFSQGSPNAGFATDAAVEGSPAAVLTPSAAMHARRAQEKPLNSARNAYHRTEKKKLQMKAHARARQKQQSAAYAVRDAERVAKWRAGAALWRSGSEGSGEEQRPQG